MIQEEEAEKEMIRVVRVEEQEDQGGEEEIMGGNEQGGNCGEADGWNEGDTWGQDEWGSEGWFNLSRAAIDTPPPRLMNLGNAYGTPEKEYSPENRIRTNALTNLGSAPDDPTREELGKSDAKVKE